MELDTIFRDAPCSHSMWLILQRNSPGGIEIAKALDDSSSTASLVQGLLVC